MLNDNLLLFLFILYCDFYFDTHVGFLAINDLLEKKVYVGILWFSPTHLKNQRAGRTKAYTLLG